MAAKPTKWPYSKTTSSVARLSKIYPKWDFGFENMPSGNPALLKRVDRVLGKYNLRPCPNLTKADHLIGKPRLF
jgi:hypothetical protein